MNCGLCLSYQNVIPSEARPSLRFLGSCAKSRYKRSIVFHWGELVGCQSNPSLFLATACHVKFFASCSLANNHWNLGIIGWYQHTFAGWLLFVVAFSLHAPSFTLSLDTPHVGHLRISANSFLYKMQSLGHAYIFWYSIPIGHNFFFAS